MQTAFSGSSQRVRGVTAFHSSHRSNPFPPMNICFIWAVTGWVVIEPSDRSTRRVWPA